MLNSGKCPTCTKTVTTVRIEDVHVAVGFENRWRGLTYVCQHCATVLSVGIDPIALKADIVNEILVQLKTPQGSSRR
jgi:hypothetical protein